MKKITFLIFFIIGTLSVYSQQLAFPGAEGFGKYATGGREGTVYRVTNLDDSGTGSLRDAVSQPNRIIIFDVSGVIKLKSGLVFKSNQTIAGQTAPGDGITVYGNRVSFSGASNVICRYVRFRMGSGGDSGKDAMGIANGKNMIFDHISTSWGRDETFSISWDNKGTEPADITIQNSIIAQGLQTHSCGGLMQTKGGVTLYRNLYIDNKTRNPKVKGLNQFVNNIVYNWGSGGAYIAGGDSEGDSWATIVNNYFIKGPEGGTDPFTRTNEKFQIIADGNYYDDNKDGSLNGRAMVQADFSTSTWITAPDQWIDIPKLHPEIENQMTAVEAYNWMKDNVGANIPKRDEPDQYVIDELLSLGMKGQLITKESELGIPNNVGYIFGAPKLVDTDNDGIPDVWETILGTNPNVDDAMSIVSGGYTNIERYINAISEPLEFLKYPVAGKVTTNAIENHKGTVSLSWTNYETAATNIVIQTSTDNKVFTDALTVAGNATTAKLENLEQATLYYIRMKSTDSTKESLYSDVISVTTDTEPTVPVLSATPNPANAFEMNYWKNITLSWQNNTNANGGALKYEVFMGTAADALSSVASNLTQAVYNAGTLAEGTTYYWRVDATNDLGTTTGTVWSFKTGANVERVTALYLPFDETSGTTATDPISGITATPVNMIPAWSAGKYENAITFSSSSADSHMAVPSNSAIEFGSTSFTVSFWFKSPGQSSSDDWYLVQKGSFGPTSGSGSGKWWGIQHNKATKITFGIDDNITKSNVDFPITNQFNNEWHHMACVRDRVNNKIIMYIDGVKVGEAVDKSTGDDIDDGTKLLIGNSTFLTNPYTGSIDDLRLYADALRADEIETLYARTKLQYIELEDDAKTVTITNDKLTETVDLRSNVTWTAVSDEPWLTPSPATSDGNGEISLTATKHTGSGPRSAIVTISGGGADEQKITVTQLPDDYIAPDLASFQFSFVGSTQKIGIKSNVEWKAVSDEDWLKITSGSGDGDGEIIIGATTNDTNAPRNAVITLTGPGVEDQTIGIIQEAAKSPILYLPFDETGGDTATDPINNHVATAVGGLTPVWEEGKLDNSVKLSTSSATSGMSIPSTTDLELNDTSFAISLWFKSNGGDATDWYMIEKGSFAKVADTDDNGKWWGIQYKTKKLVFGIDDNGDKDGIGGGKTNIDITGAEKYFNNQWQHIVCVRDKSEGKIKVYINGEFAQEKATITKHPIGEVTPLFIGNTSGSSSDNGFIGNLDEVKVYNTILTAQEIKDIYNWELITNFLTAETYDVELDAAGDTKEIAITSNANWSATSDAGWLTVDPSSGEGDGVIKITAALNGEDVRTAEITITASEIDPQVITVTQKTNKYVTLSSKDVTIAEAGATEIIDLTSNTTWAAVSDQTWLTVTPASGENSGQLSLQAGENRTDVIRTAEVTVSGTGISDQTIEVTQDYVRYLTPSVTTDDAAWTGESNDIDLTSNIAWTAVSDQTWLTITPASGTNSGQIRWTAGRNEDTNPRTAVITITSDELGDITVTITQEARPVNEDTNVHEMKINGQPVTFDAINNRVVIQQGDNSTNFSINIEVDPYATVSPSNTLSAVIRKPSLTELTFSVTSSDGLTTTPYTLVIEKRFEFLDIVRQKWDNMFIVNNNPATNGNYTFTAYKWFKDNMEVGDGKQYYTAGDNQILNTSSEYYVQVTTNGGEILRSWPVTPVLKSNSVKAYPNPAKAGQAIYVEADIEQELLENATIQVYNISGTCVSKVAVKGNRVTPVNLPAASGTYIIKLMSSDGVEKEVKIIAK